MPPGESLRPATKADVDDYVRIRATQGERSDRIGRRTAIADTDISWSVAPARRRRRRHPLADVDDWGLADSGNWVVDPQPASERSVSAREQPPREPSAQAVRDGLAENWEAEHLSAGDWPAGDWAPAPSVVLFDRELLSDRVDGVPEMPVAGPYFAPIADDAEISVARVDRAVAADRPVPPATADDIWEDRPSGQRRTVVITGRGAERGLPSRRGWEASLPVHERSGFKPDRVAMWAVLLGLILLLVAATSSHAAILTAHLAR